MPLEVLLGKAPRMHRSAVRETELGDDFDPSSLDLTDSIERVLHHPAVASKSFLITIGDRTITCLVARDQMVGPWQVPVADVAVTATSFDVYTGEAMAMGERTPLSHCQVACPASACTPVTACAATPLEACTAASPAGVTRSASVAGSSSTRQRAFSSTVPAKSRGDSNRQKISTKRRMTRAFQNGNRPGG